VLDRQTQWRDVTERRRSVEILERINTGYLVTADGLSPISEGDLNVDRMTQADDGAVSVDNARMTTTLRQMLIDIDTECAQRWIERTASTAASPEPPQHEASFPEPPYPGLGEGMPIPMGVVAETGATYPRLTEDDLRQFSGGAGPVGSRSKSDSDPMVPGTAGDSGSPLSGSKGTT